MPERKFSAIVSFSLVKSILFITRIFPLKMSYALCDFIVFAAYWIGLKRKRIALNNLSIVFPDKTEKERVLILKESIRKMLKSFFEFAFITNEKVSKERILKMADATGLEHLDYLKASNQGALLYSGHFGNFPLMIIWLALKGYPIAAVYKEANNLPDNYLGDMLRKRNVIPLKYKSDTSLTISILKALKEGRIVLIQNDQSHPLGVYINFFNKYVPSPAGPALLAKRSGVPVIPACICRDSNNHHYITISPELPLIAEEDQEKFLKINTQAQLDWIAEILIKHPTEWLWMHNRWKRAKTIETDNLTQSE